MKFFNILHLKDMCLLKVTVAIYNGSRTVDWEKECKPPLFLWSNEQLEATFNDNIAQTELPELLQKKVLAFIRPIGFEVEKWKIQHCNVLDLKTDLRKFLVWKSDGTIDQLETAIQLIQKDIFCMTKSFKLACSYCLSEFAESLWKKMSELEKTQLLNEIDRFPSPVKFYIAKFEGKNTMLNVNNCRTVEALRCLLAQIPPELCNLSLLISVHLNSQDTSILRFCLSQMNENQRRKVFVEHSVQVLCCFLQWPWQQFFVDVANQLWNYLSDCDFCSFLKFIMSERIATGWNDIDYTELLLQFWDHSPPSFKEYVKNNRIFDSKPFVDILSKHNIFLE